MGRLILCFVCGLGERQTTFGSITGSAPRLSAEKSARLIRNVDCMVGISIEKSLG